MKIEQNKSNLYFLLNSRLTKDDLYFILDVTGHTRICKLVRDKRNGKNTLIRYLVLVLEEKLDEVEKLVSKITRTSKNKK
jgi:hypothetical protein